MQDAANNRAPIFMSLALFIIKYLRTFGLGLMIASRLRGLMDAECSRLQALCCMLYVLCAGRKAGINSSNRRSVSHAAITRG